MGSQMRRGSGRQFNKTRGVAELATAADRLPGEPAGSQADQPVCRRPAISMV